MENYRLQGDFANEWGLSGRKLFAQGIRYLSYGPSFGHHLEYSLSRPESLAYRFSSEDFTRFMEM